MSNKALVVVSKPPYPLHDGAAIAEFQVIEFLYEMGYILDVIYISDKEDYDTVKNGIGKFCHKIVHKKITKNRAYLNVLIGLFCNRKPLQVNYYYSRKLKAEIKKKQGEYDLIYSCTIRTAEYTKDLLNNKKVIDYVDALSANYKVAKRRTRGLWHWIYVLESKRCKKYESKIFYLYNKRRIISDIDKINILNSGGFKENELTVIGNYTPIPNAVRKEPNNHNITFVGVMSYEPNIHAVIYFVKEILQKVITVLPDVKFYIVGKNPNSDVIQLSSKNVIVTGFVDDPNKYLDNSAITVTPMLSGSGLQNKIIQAMARGVCVITTPKGFEGMPSDEGQPIICKNANEMAQKIIDFLSNISLRKEYGHKSVEYIKKYYSRTVIFNKFKFFLE